jgi:hydroxyacylglutathione hydrolase
MFEGTAAQMLASLDQLAALPDDTLVYCAHEYTASNLRFALAVEPDNRELVHYAADVARLRADGEATVPSTIGRERAINPFLRSRLPSVAEPVWAYAGITATSEVETFRLLREWKNHFR